MLIGKVLNQLNSAARCIRVEIETQPQKLFHLARDWTEVLITRQLCEPWFTEAPNRELETKLFRQAERIDDWTWRLRIRDDAYWSDGSLITAEQLGRQVQKAHHARGAASVCTTHLRQIETENSNSIKVTTRLPIGDVRRLLTCPSLGPVKDGEPISSGKYLLGDRTTSQIHLKHINGQAEVIAMTLSGDYRAETAVDHRSLDVTSLTTNTPVGRKAPGTQQLLSSADLDIVVGLQLPTEFDDNMAEMIDHIIDRVALAREALGMLRPITMVTDIWGNPNGKGCTQPRIKGAHLDDTWDFHYTDFRPNYEVATEIRRQLLETLGTQLRLVKIPYPDYLESRNTAARSAFRLILVFPSWAHPSALLTQCYLRHLNDPLAPKGFLDHYARSVASESVANATQHAMQAERHLSNIQRGYIPIASLRSQLRSCVAVPWIPPCGWFDFSALAGGRVDGS
ncbi:MAG: hypothetical protein ACREN8_01815 [Candidatus Dormibacteraceae bacterium]